MTRHLSQENAVQTMDQPLYALAQQIKWNHFDEFPHHILRLGRFHTLSAFIASVGKLWGDGGLKALLVESGVYADASTDMMLCGKQFHRAVRGLVYEALMQIYLVQFLRWCEEEDQRAIPGVVWAQLRDTLTAIRLGDVQLLRNAVKEMSSLVAEYLVPLLDNFREWGSSRSPTFQYWCMFLDAVEILLQNIWAERVSDGKLHLATEAAMLPFFFATNRTNYSRWSPAYLIDMEHLPPEVEAAFQDGEFAIRRAPGTFNGIWSDMGTESTIIRDAKGTGGVTGLTRKEPALLRWLLTRHYLGEYSSVMCERSGHGSSTDTGHEQLKPAAMERDDQHTQMLVSHL